VSIPEAIPADAADRVALPAPRRGLEPMTAPRPTVPPTGTPTVPTGLLTLLAALDRQAAALVAALEHRLGRGTDPADPADVARLRGQLARARRVEAVTGRSLGLSLMTGPPHRPPRAR